MKRKETHIRTTIEQYRSQQAQGGQPRKTVLGPIRRSQAIIIRKLDGTQASGAHHHIHTTRCINANRLLWFEAHPFQIQ